LTHNVPRVNHFVAKREKRNRCSIGGDIRYQVSGIRSEEVNPQVLI